MNNNDRLFKLASLTLFLVVIVAIVWMILDHNPIVLKATINIMKFSAEISCEFASVASGCN